MLCKAHQLRDREFIVEQWYQLPAGSRANVWVSDRSDFIDLTWVSIRQDSEEEES